MHAQLFDIFVALIDLAYVELGSTIVTSNRPPQDWINIFPDMVMSGAILDRLVSGAHKIIVTKGKSYRKERSSVLNGKLDKEATKWEDMGSNLYMLHAALIFASASI
jgi:hypothetical protein